MNNIRKKIMFVTGTRADYGKLKSAMRAVEESGYHELFVFVAGMHLLSMFGNTYEEIIKDGFKNIYVAHGLTHSHKMSVNLGNTITHLSGYVGNINPDMVVIHGDRIDALAGAIVGALTNIVVAHIEGGEVSGTIDESIRHAISKFAHLHFVANEEAKKRIVQLGENIENIYVIGSPDIDVMLTDTLPAIEEVRKRYDIAFNNYGILLYHPVTTEHKNLGDNIKQVVDALIESKRQYVVIYPNNDLGCELILNEYSRFKNNENFAMFPSMRFEYFLVLLKNAAFMIGNSSAGIREAGIYGIPAINVGNRQNGRFNLNIIKNIQNVSEEAQEILRAIAMVDKYRIKHSYFGKGDSTKRFIKILLNEDIWNKKLQKKFVDFKHAF